jgi:activator of HSP90 ATPase
MSKTLTQSILLSASPEEIYRAWLSSEEHSEFTDSTAEIEDKVGGKFTAWDGYIEGVTLELYPYTKIVQSWRTTEFPAGSPDSRLEVLLVPEGEKTLLTLIHSNIPAGQEDQYEQGWKDFYFEPMEEYFLTKK